MKFRRTIGKSRDCYFGHTFHKTHVLIEPQKVYIQTKYMQKK